jgi:two-component system sensor histidine kinase ChvG
LLSANSRRVALEISESPQGLHAYIIMAHEARLGRVITNLLDNALSFSPEGGVVSVRARRRAADIEITVDDQGPGMPPDKLEDIFSRFYSDRPQTDRTIGKNSGLGLSISREIVTAYGGTIRASNLESADAAISIVADEPAAFRDRRAQGIVGARFTVCLPSADTAANRGAQLGRRG